MKLASILLASCTSIKAIILWFLIPFLVNRILYTIHPPIVPVILAIGVPVVLYGNLVLAMGAIAATWARFRRMNVLIVLLTADRLLDLCTVSVLLTPLAMPCAPNH